MRAAALPTHIVTTCGTSVLNQSARALGVPLPFDVSNAHQRDDIAAERSAEVQHLLEHARQEFLSADNAGAVRMSAEWASLDVILKGQWADSAMRVTLLSSDTWLGRETADIVCERLQATGVSVTVQAVPDLVTSDVRRFREAMAWLARWCQESLDRNREHIIFNATGGFKSWSAVMQSLALLYADECVFVFERTRELIRIPRLPFRFEVGELFNVGPDQLSLIRRLHAGFEVSESEATALNPILTMSHEGRATLSEWGTALWQEHRDALYVVSVLDPWSPRVSLGDDFLTSVAKAKLPPERIAMLNQRLDDLSRFAESDGSANLARLDVKPLKGGAVPHCTHEADAWADGSAPRLFLIQGKHGSWVVDHLGKALH